MEAVDESAVVAVALTLRAVSGLGTAEIAAAFLDWAQISTLYAMLERAAPGPAVTLYRAVAVGMAHGARCGLPIVEGLLADPAMRRHHRTHAVRAHLLEMAGERDAARQAYARAARLTASLPEQRHLNARAARIAR